MGADQSTPGLSSDEARLLQRRLLGRMLVDPETVGEVLATGLREVHVEGPLEVKAMRAIRELFAEGEACSPAAVVRWLQDHGRGDPGLEGWLGLLCEDPLRGAPGPVAELFLDEWGWHRLSQVALLLAKATRERRWSPLEVRRQLLAKLDDLLPPRHTDRLAGDVLRPLLALWEGKTPPARAWATGLPSLDERLAGGLRAGSLVVVAAASGMGKSALATALLDEVAVKAQVGTALFSLEMGADEYVTRIVGRRTGIALPMLNGKIADRRDIDFGELAQVVSEITTAPLWVYDSPRWSPADIRIEVQRRVGDGLRVIVIDQLDKLDHPHRDRHDLRLNASTTALKQLAQEFGIAVVLLHQLNGRKLQERRSPRPTLGDLRDAPIENDCDQVLLLHRPEWFLRNAGQKVPDNARGVLEVIVAKHRNGPTGSCRLHFDAPSARVRERDDAPQPTKYTHQASWFDPDDEEDA